MNLSKLRFSIIATSIQAHMPEKVFLYVAFLMSLPLTLFIYWIMSFVALGLLGHGGLVLAPVIDYLSTPLEYLSVSVRRSLFFGVLFMIMLAVVISLWLSFYNLMIAHCRHNKRGRQRRVWRFLLRVPPFKPGSAYIYFLLHYVTDSRWQTTIVKAIKDTTDRLRHHR